MQAPQVPPDYQYNSQAGNNDGASMQTDTPAQSAANISAKLRSNTNDSTAEKFRKKYACETKEESLNRFRKFECQNIVNSCLFLEHEEKYNNLPREKELDKEQVLGDIRLSKQDNMFNILKEFDEANDP